ncbi:MAG: hypothetical protein ACRDH2_03100, partial [Anaerolineales bacterium]
RMTFGEAWAMGQRNFWRLFVIGLLIGLITLGAALFLALPGTICFPLICVFVVVAILLSIIAYFAQIAAVTEDLSATSALGRAWQIIQANVAPIIVLGIILGGISLVIGFISFLPLLAIVVPAALAVAGFANENQNVGTASIIIASLCFLAYLPVMILIGGILQTWVTSAWTLAYQQFTRPAAAPSVGPAPTIAPS